MSLGLAQEYEELYRRAMQFARDEVEPHAAAIDRDDRFPQELWVKLAKLGWIGLGIPKEYGGSGSDALAAALVCQALARVSPALALSYGAHLNLCAHSILRNGTEEQKKKYLPMLTSGECIGAIAITEPNSGSDAMSLQTRAQPQGEDFVVSGSKMFITNGSEAGALIFYAKTDPDAAHKGLTAFIVDLPRDGFKVARKLNKLGMRGSPTAELVFEDMKISHEHMLGELNMGYRVLMSGLDMERAFLSVVSLGIAEACLAHYLTQERIAEKMPHRLARLISEYYAYRALAYQTIQHAEKGERVSRAAAAVILQAAELACRCTQQAVSRFAQGAAAETLNRLWRDAKLMEIGAGTNEIRRLLIARELLGQR